MPNITKPTKINIWNQFDEFGILAGLAHWSEDGKTLEYVRYPGESNKLLKDRVLTANNNRGNATFQGMINNISRDLSISLSGNYELPIYNTDTKKFFYLSEKPYPGISGIRVYVNDVEVGPQIRASGYPTADRGWIVWNLPDFDPSLIQAGLPGSSGWYAQRNISSQFPSGIQQGEYTQILEFVGNYVPNTNDSVKVEYQVQTGVNLYGEPVINWRSDFSPSDEGSPVPWTKINNGISGEYLTDIIYGDGVYVTVGSYSGVYTSLNGRDWTKVYTAAQRLDAVNYNSGLFIAVGVNGTIITSSGGTSWTPQSSSLPLRNLEEVIHVNGQWVIVGDTGKIQTSPDGFAWTNRSSTVTDHLYGVTYASGTYVAVGGKLAPEASGMILNSTDSITWNIAQIISGNYRLKSIDYGNDCFIATGRDGTIFRSINPTGTFTQVAILNSGVLNTWVKFKDNKFTVVDYSGGIYASYDGITWTSQPSTSIGLEYLDYGNDEFLAVGTDIVRYPGTNPRVFEDDRFIGRKSDYPTTASEYATFKNNHISIFGLNNLSNEAISGVFYTTDGKPTSKLIEIAKIVNTEYPLYWNRFRYDIGRWDQLEMASVGSVPSFHGESIPSSGYAIQGGSKYGIDLDCLELRPVASGTRAPWYPVLVPGEFYIGQERFYLFGSQQYQVLTLTDVGGGLLSGNLTGSASGWPYRLGTVAAYSSGRFFNEPSGALPNNPYFKRLHDFSNVISGVYYRSPSVSYTSHAFGSGLNFNGNNFYYDYATGAVYASGINPTGFVVAWDHPDVYISGMLVVYSGGYQLTSFDFNPLTDPFDKILYLN